MGGPWNHDDRLDEKICLFMAPKSYMATDLDCGADPFRVAMCREPLKFIEKVKPQNRHSLIYTVNKKKRGEQKPRKLRLLSS
jgi:hypothetical protein